MDTICEHDTGSIAKNYQSDDSFEYGIQVAKSAADSAQQTLMTMLAEAHRQHGKSLLRLSHITRIPYTTLRRWLTLEGRGS